MSTGIVLLVNFPLTNISFVWGGGGGENEGFREAFINCKSD